MTTRSAFVLLALIPALCIAGTSTPACHRFTFSASLEAGQVFHKAIGDALMFSLLPSSESAGGWVFEIGAPKDKDPLYIYDVTPPWRGRHQTYLDTSYGTPASEAVMKGDTEFWFVLDRHGDQVASHALRQLIFSGATQSDETSLAQLKAVPKGHGVFRIEDSTVVSGRIRRIAFQVELTVPPNYSVPTTFYSDEAACPGPWEAGLFLGGSK